MATTQTFETHQSRTIFRIDAILEAHQDLSVFRPALQISLEGARIILRGNLPTAALKQALVPAIRKAGVLGQICNFVEID